MTGKTRTYYSVAKRVNALNADAKVTCTKFNYPTWEIWNIFACWAETVWCMLIHHTVNNANRMNSFNFLCISDTHNQVLFYTHDQRYYTSPQSSRVSTHSSENYTSNDKLRKSGTTYQWDLVVSLQILTFIMKPSSYKLYSHEKVKVFTSDKNHYFTSAEYISATCFQQFISSFVYNVAVQLPVPK